MAIFHMSVKVIQRSKGSSAVAAAAYRAAEKIIDDRTGLVHDYRRKTKPVGTPLIITPDGSKISRAELWNMAEQSEKRKDATTAREYELALPCELTTEQRESLAKEFCHYLAQKNGCAVDMALHAPQGDERNFHAHILTTTRIFENGTLGKKCDIELSDHDRKAKGLDGRKKDLLTVREAWANCVNRALERAGHEIRVDHRTLAEQGIDRAPTKHLGTAATAIERKGRHSDRAAEQRERVDARKKREEELAAEEKAIAALKAEIESLKKEIAVESEQEKREREKIAAEKIAAEIDALAAMACKGKVESAREKWKKPYLDFIAQNGATQKNYDFVLERAQFDASEEGQKDIRSVDQYLDRELRKYNLIGTTKNKIVDMAVDAYKLAPDRHSRKESLQKELLQGIEIGLSRQRGLGMGR